MDGINRSMRILTICQPYARLIVRGAKRVENRVWSTTYRGPLLIHAGKSRSWLGKGEESAYESSGELLEFGAIVGMADLIDVVHISQVEAGDLDAAYPWLRYHVHASGPYCFVLDAVRRFSQPITWKGGQGLRTFTDLDLLPEGVRRAVA